MGGEEEVEQDDGAPETVVPSEALINGDLIHEKQMETALPEADGISVESSVASAKVDSDMTRSEEVGELPESSPAESPSRGAASYAASSPTPAVIIKGKGLKRWKRIARRDQNKDGGVLGDAGRILKRGFSVTEHFNAKDDGSRKGHSEDESSVASMDSNNTQNASYSPATAKLLDSDLELLASVGSLSIGIDSETSDDRSSRFSTAASVPRSKHEGLGHGKDKNPVKSIGGEGSRDAVQPRGQRGKESTVDATKKAREGQLFLEKEISFSSIESDLRSSTSVIAQQVNTTSNGRRCEGFLQYDRTQESEDVQTVFNKEKVEDIEDSFRYVPHTGKFVMDEMEETRSCPSQEKVDSLSESLILLQKAQEELEKELQNIMETGLESTLSVYSSFSSNHEEMEVSSSLPPELKVVMLNKEVDHLQRKLEKASSVVKAKGSGVTGLEPLLEQSGLPKYVGYADIPQEMVEEVVSELECLFRQKIEMEVEYLIVSNGLRRTSCKAFNFTGPQEHLIEGYREVKVKLKITEDKVILLNRTIEELNVTCQELLETEEVLELQNGLLPPLGEVVPT